MSIFNKVKLILMDQLPIEDNEVTMDAKIVDDLGADSLDVVEIIMACEEDFNIEIPDRDAEKMKTVRDMVDYITANTYKEEDVK